jgi:tetratricopeptide (TPR) repeat protein
LRDIVRLAPSRERRREDPPRAFRLRAIEIPENAPAPPPAAARPAASSATETPAPPQTTPRQINVETAPDAEVRYAVARGSYIRARQLMDSRDFFGAIVLFEECVRLAPESPEYHYRLACALSKNPRWGERTITQFKKALALAPGRQDAMRDFAEFLLSRNRAPEAREYAVVLLDRSPEDPRHSALLGLQAAMGIAPLPSRL